MGLRRWLGLSEDPAEPLAGGLEQIEQALEHLEPERARFIACFAYILGRVARADHHVSAGESAEMARLVSEHTGLAGPEAEIAVGIATTHGLKHGGTEDFIVTREFARIATREQRLALLDTLYALSSFEGTIVMLEDNEVRRIASELKLEHADFISARAKYLNHLRLLGRAGESGS